MQIKDLRYEIILFTFHNENEKKILGLKLHS